MKKNVWKKVIAIGMLAATLAGNLQVAYAADFTQIADVQKELSIAAVSVSQQRMALSKEPIAGDPNYDNSIYCYDFSGNLVFTFPGTGLKESDLYGQVFQTNMTSAEYIIEEYAVSGQSNRLDFYDFSGNFVKSEVVNIGDTEKLNSYIVPNAIFTTESFIEDSDVEGYLEVYTGDDTLVGRIPIGDEYFGAGYYIDSYVFLEHNDPVNLQCLGVRVYQIH